MRMVDLIRKKRDGRTLSKEEIDYIITGYVQGEIPDYQMAALAMAIYYQGMDQEETANLTWAMATSGDQIDLSAIQGIKVDKHSTGGVGDKTTLIVAPLVATLGLPVAKMSGRGLGHTGGTIDKLESIAGFRAELEPEQFVTLVRQNGLAIASQSANLVPADRKWYALRDVTATVDSLPLIASSIMSKKLASGAEAIVLDVKTGSGAFMKSLDEATRLAEAMVSIGKNLGRKTKALITDMNQPLGHCVGNALEVREAIEVLKGEGEERLTTLCLTLAAHMLVAGGRLSHYEQAYDRLEQILKSGEALETFKRFVAAQGGDVSQIDEPNRLPLAPVQLSCKAKREGYVSRLDAEGVGKAAMLLGAGRLTKEEPIDHGVGIVLRKKVGDYVRQGDVMAILYSNEKDPQDALTLLEESISISEQRVEPPPLIYKIIE